MSTPIRIPSTPQAQTASAPDTPTGTWRHPRMDEINRRVRQNTFNERNVHRILWNGSSLLATVIVPRILASQVPSLVTVAKSYASPYGTYILLAIRLLFAFNIFCACIPLFAKPDDLSDIPLTPSQRSLLGLPPSNAPLTPGSQYITPPRYARSSTPSRRGSSTGSRPASPISGTGFRSSSGPESPLAAAARSTAAQMAPSSGSPMMRRATDNGRRQSADLSFLTRSNILAMDSSTMSMGSIPGSPTPAGIGGGKGPSVGLNNKWLYERGGSSPGKRSLFM